MRIVFFLYVPQVSLSWFQLRCQIKHLRVKKPYPGIKVSIVFLLRNLSLSFSQNAYCRKNINFGLWNLVYETQLFFFLLDTLENFTKHLEALIFKNVSLVCFSSGKEESYCSIFWHLHWIWLMKVQQVATCFKYGWSKTPIYSGQSTVNIVLVFFMT